jgi:hypothetical protein
MTTLAANLSDSAMSLRVNAAVTDPAEFYQIDNEIIWVAAVTTTVNGSLSPVRYEDDTLWQIKERGVSTTAPASHTSGATVTPLLLGAGGGGGVTVTDGTTTVTGATTLSLPPGTVVDEGSGEAFHTGGFIASVTDPGAVGEGVVWKDISLGHGLNAKWWERNTANTGWDAYFIPRVVVAGANSAIANVYSVASGSGAAEASLLAEAAGASPATAGLGAHALGAGNAVISGTAEADGDGTATGGITALTSGTGQATANLGATAEGDGAASSFLGATADGSGPASGGVSIQTVTGLAYMAVIAYRGAEQAGMTAEIDGTSARLAFNDATPIPKPIVPLTTPDAQDVIDALVALGLIAQSD